jgi:hypothetical protein
LAVLAGEKAPELGVRLPLRWLAESGRLAMAIEANGPEDGWLILLDPPNPSGLLAELKLEPGLKLEVETEAEDGINYRLYGSDGSPLHLTVIGPWLAVSNFAQATAFARESWDNPDFSLANSGLIPEWRRGAELRGAVNPTRLAQSAPGTIWAKAAEWLSPEARLAFTAGLDSSGNMETRLESRLFSGEIRGGGVWPLVRLLAVLAGAACLLLIVGIAMAALGMGAWLKILALKAGLTLAPAPLPVKPSAAFREDAGLEDEAEEVAAVVEEADGRDDGGHPA